MSEPTTQLEQLLYEDIDMIAELSAHGLTELDTGDLDGLEGSIQAINDIATSWSDPEDAKGHERLEKEVQE